MIDGVMALDLMVICMTLSRKDHKIREIREQENIIPGDLDLMATSMILSGNKDFSRGKSTVNNIKAFNLMWCLL